LAEALLWPPRRKPLLFVLSGPSGAGKDSVRERLKACFPEIHFATTITTRAIRPGEVADRDYYFHSVPVFQAMREAGELLEYAAVYRDWYGTPRAQVEPALAAGQDVMVKVDVQGAETIRAAMPEAIGIFLAPGSLVELEARLRRRRSEDEEALQVRLSKVRAEMARIPAFDYVVLNAEGGLDRAVAETAAIIRAERCRVARLAV
jgi:guanylate kinase